MGNHAADLRLAVRRLARTPGFTTVAILTLTLGIGINVAIFSVVEGVLLAPLPFRDPARLVFVGERSGTQPETSLSYLDWRDLATAQQTLDGLAVAREVQYTLSGLGPAERVDAAEASADWFRVLGVEPDLGRAFADDEALPGATPVAVVSHAFWRARLHGDPAAVGRTLTLEGRPFTIIGVLPARFHYGGDPALWVTVAHMNAAYRDGRGVHAGLFGVGRLRAGVALAQARADLQGVARALHRDEAEPLLPTVTPLHAHVVAPVGGTLWLLFGAVAFVMLIACTNVANLLLARGLRRNRELAVRAALGATRARLMLPLLVESALIALAGAALGVLLAAWLIDALVALAPATLPATTPIGIDRAVLAYCLALTLFTTLACGLLPSLKSAHVELGEALKAGARGIAGGTQRRLRGALVVAEVAMAMVLLVGAGLSIRTLRHLQSRELGFAGDGILKARLSIPPTHHPDLPSLHSFLRETRTRLAAIPGVESASLSLGLPLTNYSSFDFWVERPTEATAAAVYTVSPGYVRTLGATLLAGREFDDGDNADGEPVCLVDDRVARRFFPGGAVGRVISVGDPDKPSRLRIVGVVRHMVDMSLEGEALPFQLWLPLEQAQPMSVPQLRRVYVALRGPRPETLAAPARATLAALDPDVPMAEVMTMTQAAGKRVDGRRFAMLLLGLFGLVGLLLALTGLYAVMSFLVAQRQHEIGVRMALGADAARVQRMVVRQGVTLVLLGLAFGTAVSLALTRVMAALVFDLSATDPATYAAVAALLVVAALLASLLPARAASRVDPMVALRAD